MGVYIKGIEMPTRCGRCDMRISVYDDGMFDHYECCITAAIIDNLGERMEDCPLVPIPPHGDLIDRDALIKDGWLNLHKEVMRMGGYAIHELPLKNPSIPVIIRAEGEE